LIAFTAVVKLDDSYFFGGKAIIVSGIERVPVWNFRFEI